MKKPIALAVLLFVALPVFAQTVRIGTAPIPPPRPLSLDAAFATCNRAGCNLEIPAGTFTFSIQISPQAIVRIEGAGASYDNVSPHCLTTVIWTGGNMTPILLNTWKAQGSSISGFCLDSVTEIPAFIDVDNSADDVHLSDIVIDYPTKKASYAGIRWGYEGKTNTPFCKNVFVRAAAPIGFFVGNVEAHFMGENCRGVWNDEIEWQIGDQEHLVQSFHCLFCTAAARFGKTPIVIRYVDDFSWSEGYFEGFQVVEIPADAILAQQITLTNNFVNGGGEYRVVSFVHSALSTATITLIGNRVESGFLIDDEALTRATIIGNTTGGSAPGFEMPSGIVAKYGIHVCSFGNTAAPAPMKPLAGVCN